MKRILSTTSIIISSFLLGYGFNTMLMKDNVNQSKLKKVTGIGGVFFKAKDPKALNEWYKKNLGFNISPYGTSFEWRDIEDSTKKGVTQWNLFTKKSRYFAPSKKDFMINYRVDDMVALLVELKNEKVSIIDTIEDTEYGKFIHIVDIEGNKIQLWEPK